MDTVDKVLEILIQQNIIPEIGIFEITDWLIDTYCHLYKNISKKETATNFKQNKPSNKRYARKMAGVVLNRLLAKR